MSIGFNALMPGTERWTSPAVWRERSRLVRAWRLLRTRRPVTFNDKVRYKLLRDRRQLMVTFADKAACRDHVASVVGTRSLPRLVAVLDDPAGLLTVPLPTAYVVKPTHGSGAGVVVSGGAPASARLPAAERGWGYTHVRTEHVDRTALAAVAGGWLRQLYGRGPNHEWAYGQVPPRVLVEEFLAGPDGAVPQDYKLFVFHERCRFIQVDAGRFTHRTQDFYDRDWDRLALRGGVERSADGAHRPARLDEMLALAERLGAGTDFVRVDLYCLPDRVVVGELTSAPAAGDSPFDPPMWNEVFGSSWQVPRRYR